MLLSCRWPFPVLVRPLDSKSGCGVRQSVPPSRSRLAALASADPAIQPPTQPMSSAPVAAATMLTPPSRSLSSPVVMQEKPQATGRGVTPSKVASLSTLLHMPAKMVESLLAKNPQLLTVDISEVANHLRALCPALGLSPKEATYMLSKQPVALLLTPIPTLQARVASLAELTGVPAAAVVRWSTHCPVILKREPALVAARVFKLSNLLGGAQPVTVMRMCSEASQLLTDSFSGMAKRLDALSCILCCSRRPAAVLAAVRLQPDLLFMSSRILSNKVSVLMHILDKPKRLVVPLLLKCPALLRSDFDNVRATYQQLQPLLNRDAGFVFAMACHDASVLLESLPPLRARLARLRRCVHIVPDWMDQWRWMKPPIVQELITVTNTTLGRLEFLVVTRQANSIQLQDALLTARIDFLHRYPQYRQFEQRATASAAAAMAAAKATAMHDVDAGTETASITSRAVLAWDSQARPLHHLQAISAGTSTAAAGSFSHPSAFDSGAWQRLPFANNSTVSNGLAVDSGRHSLAVQTVSSSGSGGPGSSHARGRVSSSSSTGDNCLVHAPPASVSSTEAVRQRLLQHSPHPHLKTRHRWQLATSFVHPYQQQQLAVRHESSAADSTSSSDAVSAGSSKGQDRQMATASTPSVIGSRLAAGAAGTNVSVRHPLAGARSLSVPTPAAQTSQPSAVVAPAAAATIQPTALANGKQRRGVSHGAPAPRHAPYSKSLSTPATAASLYASPGLIADPTSPLHHAFRFSRADRMSPSVRLRHRVSNNSSRHLGRRKTGDAALASRGSNKRNSFHSSHSTSSASNRLAEAAGIALNLSAGGQLGGAINRSWEQELRLDGHMGSIGTVPPYTTDTASSSHIRPNAVSGHGLRHAASADHEHHQRTLAFSPVATQPLSYESNGVAEQATFDGLALSPAASLPHTSLNKHVVQTGIAAASAAITSGWSEDVPSPVQQSISLGAHAHSHHNAAVDSSKGLPMSNRARRGGAALVQKQSGGDAVGSNSGVSSSETPNLQAGRAAAAADNAASDPLMGRHWQQDKVFRAGNGVAQAHLAQPADTALRDMLPIPEVTAAAFANVAQGMSPAHAGLQASRIDTASREDAHWAGTLAVEHGTDSALSEHLMDKAHVVRGSGAHAEVQVGSALKHERQQAVAAR